MKGLTLAFVSIFAWAALDAPAEFCLAVACIGVIAAIFSRKPKQET